jgi:iron(III) transport system ATP-binding protein
MALLQIRNLKKSYGSAQILKGIGLDIEQGELISLLGPSGSGKTTVLRCIAGLEIPDKDSGEMLLDGKVLSGKGTFLEPEKRRMGMVFQNYAVWPHMNVFDNVAFPLRIQAKKGEIAREEVRRRTMEALSLVKLDTLSDRFAHQLSGGQQQRVALARALGMKPTLLLLDEPLSNLDAILREELGAEIRRLQKSLNLTTILVTHDQREALSLSDRIIILNHGQIESQGIPETLYSAPPSEFSAEFLAGGQRVQTKSGSSKLFLPRRWTLQKEPSGSASVFKIVSRIYLGSEYEYWAQNPEYSEPIRFFGNTKVEIGSTVALSYSTVGTTFT